jgi:iron complex outermembrane receptor protein
MITILRMGPAAGADGYVLRMPYRAAAYSTLDFRIAKRIRAAGNNLEIALAGTNLGPRHQEIADRSEQFLHPDGPANPVSRMVFLSLRIDIH